MSTNINIIFLTMRGKKIEIEITELKMKLYV